MRILYFHQHFTTPSGSGGTRSYEFARALLAKGHQVTMVCGRSDGSKLEISWIEQDKWHRGLVDGIDTIALPIPYSNSDSIVRRSFLFLKYAWRSVIVARRFEYDLLFATSTPLTAALPGIAMKFFGRRRPFVFEVRDLWPELPRALGMRNPILLGGMSVLEWLAYRYADACIGLSPGIVEGIRRRAPAEREVVMIPNGCDLDLFHPDLRAPLMLEGIEPRDFVAGFTGAHGIANGLDALLDVAAELNRRGRHDIKLALIGDGNRKPMLVERARREGLDNCRFYSPIKKTEIAKLTASFDCGLMILADVPAFYYGTSPNKFFDYISAGLPVICNYDGWLAEMIEAEGCGIAVPARDPVRFADALGRLADDRAEARRMGIRGRKFAEREFDRHALAARFVTLLEQVA